MTLKKLALAFAAVAAMVMTGSAKTIFVSASGTGEGTGWGDTCSFAAAMAAAGEGDEIWLTKGDYTVPAGTTYENANAITIRGGFAGSEASAEERTPGERSRLIGGTSATSTSGTIALKLTATSGTVTIEDLDIESVYQGVYKAGAASFVARNVRVISCGRNGGCYQGRGMYLFGNATTKPDVTLSNCEFRGNYVTGSGSYSAPGCDGCATYLENLGTARIENCLYYNNGLAFGTVSSAPGRDQTHGMAFFCKSAKLVCTGTRFIGNAACTKSAGGVIRIDSCTSGSSFENCAFIGNFDAPWDASPGVYGTLFLAAAANGDVLNIDRCTFAYNLSRPQSGCWGAALSVTKGKAVIRNSIFHGNVIHSTTAGAAADMAACNANATIDIDWSAVDGNSSLYMNAAAGVLTKGDNMIYGSDPLFPTDTTTALSFATTAGLKSPVSDAASNNGFAYKSGSDLMAFDFRLPSKSGSWNGSAWVTDEVSSPLIDKGDPASDWTAEPEPNGSCVNLGYLGGTSHASKSAAAEPGIASYVLDAESDYSQPHVRMTMGGAGTYSSTVCFCWGAAASAESGTNGWDNVTVVATGVSNGNFVDARPMQYLTPSSEIAWRVVVMTEGFDDIARDGTATCGDAYPPWYDRGGGASVIHVRAGATGKGDGTSWTDAYDTFDQALAALSAERPTIWISASWSLTKDVVPTVIERNASIYGGFVGTENAPSDRPAGKYTSINGEKTYNTFALSNEAAVVLDSFEFYNAKEIAFVKSGNGDLTLRNCVIRDNGYDSTKSVKGRAFRAIGCPEATLRFENCTFKANQFRGNDGSCGYAFGCAGAHFESLRRVIFDGCLFLENGYDRAKALDGGSVPGREGSYGGIFLARNTPVTAVNTRFIGNRQTGHGGNAAAMLWIDGAAEKSAFTNCLWTANQVLGYDSQGVGNPSPSSATGVAIVYVNNAAATTPVDFVSCTVAYNPSESSVCGAITVNKGACTVRNSIFYGNLICGQTAPADLKLVSGTLDIAYTLFAENSARYFSQTATLGAGMVYGDPKFVASPAEFLAEVNNAPAELPVVTFPRLYPKSDDSSVSAAYNLHLIGGFYIDETTGERVSMREVRRTRGVSPVLTAGDPASPRDRQPAPRGKAINLGYYGNTPNASTVPGGLLLIVR